jgi:hypothetical protein
MLNCGGACIEKYSRRHIVIEVAVGLLHSNDHSRPCGKSNGGLKLESTVKKGAEAACERVSNNFGRQKLK